MNESKRSCIFALCFWAVCLTSGVSADKHLRRHQSFLPLEGSHSLAGAWPTDGLTAFGSDLSPGDFPGMPRAAIGIGAQKCATTLMWKILRLHPEVITKHKETRWFQKPQNSRCHLQTKGDLVPVKDRSSDERQVWTYDLYVNKCFGGRRPNGTRITWEFSPGYMRYNKPAPHFLSLLSDSAVLRFVAVIRDPVDRVISEYNMRRKNAFLGEWRVPTKLLKEQAALSEKAGVSSKDKDLAKKRHRRKRRHAFAKNFTEAELQSQLLTDLGKHSDAMHGDGFAKGEYVDQLEQWFTHFPAESILVVNLHALNNTETWQRIFRHVGVSQLPTSQVETMIKQASLEYHIGQASKFGKDGMPHLEISDEARLELLAHYEPYNRRLWKLFGGGHWW